MSNQAHQHGAQYAHTWLVGEDDERVMASHTDEHALKQLARVCLLGDVFVRLQWGSGQMSELVDLRAPFLALVPGRYQVFARPRDTGLGATAVLSSVPVASGTRPCVRTFFDASGGAVALDVRAAWFVASAPSALTVLGVVSGAVPVGARIPLMPPSVLTGGAGAVEFEI
jgi:hypothetical protein